MSMDHFDERIYGKSDGPYHIKKSLIKTKHVFDPTLVERVKANVKVLNSTAPQVQANFWGIYDMDKKEIVQGKLVNTR